MKTAVSFPGPDGESVLSCAACGCALAVRTRTAGLSTVSSEGGRECDHDCHRFEPFRLVHVKRRRKKAKGTA